MGKRTFLKPILCLGFRPKYFLKTRDKIAFSFDLSHQFQSVYLSVFGAKVEVSGDASFETPQFCARKIYHRKFDKKLCML